MKAWAGTGRTVQVKQTLEKEQKYGTTRRPSEDLGREAKREGRGPLDRCVMVGEVSTGSIIH